MASFDRRIAVLETRLLTSECNCSINYKIVFESDPDPEPTNCPVHGPVSNVIRITFVGPEPP
jgi:hypothetical protein